MHQLDSRNSPVSSQLYECTFGNGTFVIVGQAARFLQVGGTPVSLRIAAAGPGIGNHLMDTTELPDLRCSSRILGIDKLGDSPSELRIQ
jgi:hypothetical protein